MSISIEWIQLPLSLVSHIKNKIKLKQNMQTLYWYKRKKKMPRDWLTDLFRNEAESFLYSIWKLCAEYVNKSDKLSMSVLTFLEDTNRHCTHVWCYFLSIGARTARIGCIGRDNDVLVHVTTTDNNFLHLSSGIHWNYWWKWVKRFSKLS